MKYLRTHARPHLDDICAFWLFKRYLPEAKEAELGFVEGKDRAQAKDDADTVHVGIGGGKYDEHKGDVGDCATTLVWKDIMTRVEIPEREKRAVQKIVDWALLEDTGKMFNEPRRAFSVPAILGGYFDGHGADSLQQTMFGFDLLDSLIVSQRNEVHVEDIWASRTEFDSRYGRAVAMRGTARQMEPYAYGQGFDLVLVVNDGDTYQTIRAKGNSDIDLTPTAEALKVQDSNADWYFHHSKKMLICGGDHAPHARTSALKMEQLIELLKR